MLVLAPGERSQHFFFSFYILHVTLCLQRLISVIHLSVLYWKAFSATSVRMHTDNSMGPRATCEQKSTLSFIGPPASFRDRKLRRRGNHTLLFYGSQIKTMNHVAFQSAMFNKISAFLPASALWGNWCVCVCVCMLSSIWVCLLKKTKRLKQE